MLETATVSYSPSGRVQTGLCYLVSTLLFYQDPFNQRVQLRGFIVVYGNPHKTASHPLRQGPLKDVKLRIHSKPAILAEAINSGT